jgi:hypothetical protein
MLQLLRPLQEQLQRQQTCSISSSSRLVSMEMTWESSRQQAALLLPLKSQQGPSSALLQSWTHLQTRRLLLSAAQQMRSRGTCRQLLLRQAMQQQLVVVVVVMVVSTQLETGWGPKLLVGLQSSASSTVVWQQHQQQQQQGCQAWSHQQMQGQGSRDPTLLLQRMPAAWAALRQVVWVTHTQHMTRRSSGRASQQQPQQQLVGRHRW